MLSITYWLLWCVSSGALATFCAFGAVHENLYIDRHNHNFVKSIQSISLIRHSQLSVRLPVLLLRRLPFCQFKLFVCSHQIFKKKFFFPLGWKVKLFEVANCLFIFHRSLICVIHNIFYIHIINPIEKACMQLKYRTSVWLLWLQFSPSICFSIFSKMHSCLHTLATIKFYLSFPFWGIGTLSRKILESTPRCIRAEENKSFEKNDAYHT